jgi:hypothetical protein
MPLLSHPQLKGVKMCKRRGKSSAAAAAAAAAAPASPISSSHNIKLVHQATELHLSLRYIPSGRSHSHFQNPKPLLSAPAHPLTAVQSCAVLLSPASREGYRGGRQAKASPSRCRCKLAVCTVGVATRCGDCCEPLACAVATNFNSETLSKLVNDAPWSPGCHFRRGMLSPCI